MMPKNLSALVRGRIWQKFLSLSSCLIAGCTTLSGLGGSGGDDDGSGASFLEIAFAEDLNDPLYARAKTDEGDEFAVFVERADDGEPVALRGLASQLADGTVVTAVADDTGRPARFEDADSSVTIIYRTSDATAIYTDALGLSTEAVFALPQAVRSTSKATTESQTIGANLLCTNLLASYRSIVAVVFDCSGTPDSPLCSSVIAQAAHASLRLCSEDSSIVPDAQLETRIATDPEALGVGIGLSVVAAADTRHESGQTIVELNGVATGGISPYTITWVLSEGPTSPIIPDGASTEVALDQTGAYTIVVTATDSGGESATETIVVDVVVATPVAPLSANAGLDRTATSGIAIILEGSATGGADAYACEWSPATGLSDPNATQPTLSLDEPGTFTYTFTVTDGGGAEATDSITVVVVEPLVANAGPNTTVFVGQTFTLQGSARRGDGAYNYEWTPTTGISDPNVGQPALNATDVGIGIIEFTLTVTDGTGATDSDTVIVTIIEGGGPAPTTISSIMWNADYAGAGYQVLVEFSQGMNQASAEMPGNYRINGTMTNPTTASLSGDRRTATLVFGVSMTTTDTIDVSVGGSILDFLGRALPEALNQAITANADDTTNPTISSVTWADGYTTNGYQAVVAFSESVDESTAETAGNYDVNNGANDAPGTAVLGADGKTVTLTWAPGDLTNPLDGSDTLDISLANSITDINAQTLTVQAAQAVTAHGSDATAPTISSVTWANGYTTNGYQAVVTFNESLDESTAETAGNYDVNNGGNDAPGTAVLATDGKTVTLTWAPGDLTNPLDGSDTLDISLANTITDINAQTLTAQAAQAVTAHGSDATAPTISSVTYGSEATNYIAIATFNESLDESTAETAANYDINNGDNAAPNTAALATDGKTVTLTWTTAELTQPWAIADTMDISIGNTVTDINAQTLTAAAGTAIAANGADGAGPANPAVGHVALSTDVTLVFDEVMDEATCEVNTFSTSGAPTQVGNAVLSDDGRTVTVTFTADPTTLNIIIPITLMDINGNAYAGAALAIPN